MNKFIYLDHAATTAARPEVVQEMLPYFTKIYGNPSTSYEFSSPARQAVAKSREVIAKSLGTDASDIYFTAGGTESDNWALKAVAEQYGNKGRHIITSRIEHHAVLHSAEYLERQGFEITYIGVDENGIIRLDELKSAIRADTILISIMFANNEIGTIQPIREIGALAHAHGIIFHTDAVQAYGQIPIHVEEMNIDMLSASGHKLSGPKGIGFLYVRKEILLGSFLHGGAQEQKRRAGTENVPGIVGLGRAAEIAMETMQARFEREIKLRNYLIDNILAEIPYTRLNGCRKNRLPNNVNLSFQFIEGESLLVMLDMAGICASSGSACTSGSQSPSHVLLAIGLPDEVARGSLRLTLGEENTRAEMDYVIRNLKQIVERQRSISPLYEDYMRR